LEEQTMFDDPRDMNRDTGYRDPARDPYANLPAEGSGYALPAAIVAIILIIGGLVVFAPKSDNVQTAANRPATEQSAPAPIAPAPPPPAPAK
jgi:hypothetical protein